MVEVDGGIGPCVAAVEVESATFCLDVSAHEAGVGQWHEVAHGEVSGIEVDVVCVVACVVSGFKSCHGAPQSQDSVGVDLAAIHGEVAVEREASRQVERPGHVGWQEALDECQVAPVGLYPGFDSDAGVGVVEVGEGGTSLHGKCPVDAGVEAVDHECLHVALCRQVDHEWAVGP